RRAVRVIAVEREQDRLLARFALAPGTVREEAVVAKGPQVRVECLDPLFRSRLHDHAPAALEGFFDQRGKHTLERLTLQLVKYDFRHDDRAIIPCAPTSPLRSQRLSILFSYYSATSRSNRRTPKPEPQLRLISLCGEPMAVPAMSRCAHGVLSTKRCNSCAAVMAPP